MQKETCGGKKWGHKFANDNIIPKIYSENKKHQEQEPSLQHLLTKFHDNWLNIGRVIVSFVKHPKVKNGDTILQTTPKRNVYSENKKHQEQEPSQAHLLTKFHDNWLNIGRVIVSFVGHLHSNRSQRHLAEKHFFANISVMLCSRNFGMVLKNF